MQGRPRNILHVIQKMNGLLFQAHLDLEAGNNDLAKERIKLALELCTIPNIVDFTQNLQLLFPEKSKPRKVGPGYVRNMDKENYYLN